MAAHGYIAESFDTFGLGLNLSDKEDAVSPGEAIDLLNVDFTTRGAVKQRQGYANFATSQAEPPQSMVPYYKTDGTRQLVVGGTTKCWALNTSGSAVATSAVNAGKAWNFCRRGRRRGRSSRLAALPRVVGWL